MLYLRLFSKEIRFRIPFAIVSCAVFLAVFYADKRYIGTAEYICPVFALISAAILFFDDEKEILTVGRVNMGDLFLVRFLSAFLSVTLIPSLWIIAFTAERKSFKAFLAFFVLSLFVSAIGGFWRAVSGNTLASLLFSFGTYAAIMLFSAFGGFSPFASMMTADEKTFLINRLVTAGAGIVLLILSYVLFRQRSKLSSAV